MKTPYTFFRTADSNIAEFNDCALRTNPDARADHICYRCGDTAEFERFRAMFEHESKFIHQAIISNRRIAIIALQTSVATVLGPIKVLELSDQKPDGSQHSGFDHIEIYPYTNEESVLVENLIRSGEELTQTVRPHHTTHDLLLPSGFKVRIEPEPLLEKIRAGEMDI